MARPLRIEYPGAVYHVTGRGNDKKAIFRTDADRMAFLDTLQRVTLRYHWLWLITWGCISPRSVVF